jgi:DNA-binding transcriptional LysR family regulator
MFVPIAPERESSSLGAVFYTIPMTLSQLKGFLAVVDSSSFSEAALELGVSQAAISHSIA